MCLYHTLTFIQKPPPKEGTPLYKTPPIRNQEPNNSNYNLQFCIDNLKVINCNNYSQLDFLPIIIVIGYVAVLFSYCDIFATAHI